MIHSKNQMIRSMKSYEEGGSTENCGPGDGGCKAGKAARKNRRRQNWNNFTEGAGKVLGPIMGLGVLAGAGVGAKKLMDQQKKGGAVKRTTKKK